MRKTSLLLILAVMGTGSGIMAETPMNIPATQPTTAPVTQPATGKLEFHIVPNGVGSSHAPAMTPFAQEWVELLAHKGPAAAPKDDDDLAWFELAGEVNCAAAVTGEYQGRKYVLLANRPPFVMAPGPGKDAWGLAKVAAIQDDQNHPAIAFEFDDRGAQLFATLTKANVGNTLAIVADGKVIATPVLQSALGKQGIISGHFTDEQAHALVRSLQLGGMKNGKR